MKISGVSLLDERRNLTKMAFDDYADGIDSGRQLFLLDKPFFIYRKRNQFIKWCARSWALNIICDVRCNYTKGLT